MARTIRVPPGHKLNCDPTPSLAMAAGRPGTVPIEGSNSIGGRGPFEGPQSIQQPVPNQQIPLIQQSLPTQQPAPVQDPAETENAHQAHQAHIAAEALNRRHLTHYARLIRRGRPLSYTSQGVPTPAPDLRPIQVFNPFAHPTIFPPPEHPLANAETISIFPLEQSSSLPNNALSIIQSSTYSPQRQKAAQRSLAAIPTRHPTAPDAETALTTFSEWTCHLCQHYDKNSYHCRKCGHVQCGACKPGVDEIAYVLFPSPDPRRSFKSFQLSFSCTEKRILI